MKNLMLIHGAWSNGRGFKFIEQNIKYDNINEVVIFKYDCNNESLPYIVDKARLLLKNLRTNTVIVGHSLGGIIALALHNETYCDKIITLSAPLAGIEIPLLLEHLALVRAPVLNMISVDSYFMKDLRTQKYKKNIHSFITTKGFNPFILDKTDGIVTIKSQEDWLPSSAYTTYVRCSHFEILQQDEVVNLIDYYTK